MREKEWKRRYDLAEKLLHAVLEGPVHSCGSIYTKSGYLMSQSDMHDAVRRLARAGINVVRTDSGGSPTWALAD